MDEIKGRENGRLAFRRELLRKALFWELVR